MENKLSLVLFLSCILASGCGTDSNKQVQEEGNQAEIDSPSQASVNKEILEQLTRVREETSKLREETSDLRNKVAELQTRPAAPRVTSQSVGVVSQPADQPDEPEAGNFPINTAAAIGNIARVRQLVEGGAEINSLTDGSTPLHNAVENGREEIVKYLIANGADVNKKNSSGSYPADLAQNYGRDKLTTILREAGGRKRPSPLPQEQVEEKGESLISEKPKADLEFLAYSAIREGDSNQLVKLIADGFDVNARFEKRIISAHRYPIGMLPLAAAIHSGNPVVLQILLKKGAKIVHDPSTGDLPLITCMGEILAQHEQEDVEKKVKYREIFRQLLAAQPDLANKKDEKSAPLFYAANASDDQLSAQLLTAGADPNIRDNAGLTPLHVALMANDHSHEADGGEHGHQEEVSLLLLKHGADFRATGKKGQNILILSCMGGHTNLVNALIKKGANPNAKDSFGVTPLLAALTAPDHTHAQGDHRQSHQEEMAQLLLSAGADVNTSGPNSETPIKIAVGRGYTNLVKLIIDKGVNFDQAGLGVELLILASIQGNTSLAENLIENGVNINSEGKDGQTSLHAAARFGQAKFCKYLIDAGANINKLISDGPYFGDTPLDSAYTGANDGKRETIKVLKTAGGKSGRK